MLLWLLRESASIDTARSKIPPENINKVVIQKIPLVVAPNMSIGVNVLFKLVADAARVLGDDYDVEIVEVDDAFIRNVNTPEEFEEAKKEISVLSLRGTKQSVN